MSFLSFSGLFEAECLFPKNLLTFFTSIEIPFIMKLGNTMIGNMPDACKSAGGIMEVGL